MSRKKKKAIKKLSSLGDLTIALEPDAMKIFKEALDHMSADDISDKLADPKAGDLNAVRNNKSQPRLHEIDLHGLTLADAQCRIDRWISAHLGEMQKENVFLKVITGKGLHSGPQGGVLTGGIHHYLWSKYNDIIKELEESPDDVRVGGVPIRGYFSVVFRIKR